MSTADRIKDIQKAALPARLLNGARVLGELWRNGTRCLGEWSGICPCRAPNDFCEAKKRWLSILREFHGTPLPYGLVGTEGFLVLEAMTVKMFEATGLTIRVEVPPARVPMRFGPKGTTFQTLIDLAAIDDDVERIIAVDAVIRLQEVFK